MIAQASLICYWANGISTCCIVNRSLPNYLWHLFQSFLLIDFGETIMLQNRDIACKIDCGLKEEPAIYFALTKLTLLHKADTTNNNLNLH